MHDYNDLACSMQGVSKMVDGDSLENSLDYSEIKIEDSI